MAFHLRPCHGKPVEGCAAEPDNGYEPAKGYDLEKGWWHEPVEGCPAHGGAFPGACRRPSQLPRWNVRFHDGIFYLINHVSGWQEELAMWQVVSLEEAFQQDYIMGHSQMGSPSTNYAPIWNTQAGQWLLATTHSGPNQQAGQVLDLELLHYRVEERQRREQARRPTRWSKGARALAKAGKMILSTGGRQIMAGGKEIGVPLTHPVDLQGPAGA